MTAMAACRTCGTEPLENARFCHGCGTPVHDGDARAEYKQVTVLFADVVHSMDIAASVGPERLREIMAQLVERAAEVVQRFGGTVDKFTGDGIMAVFGAPVALEDHAIRACRAALRVQDDTKRLADEIRQRDDVDLRLRIGLNSGQVIAGEIGSGPFGYTAVGEQVGLAQRMESAALPGGVMLGESTARLVEGAATLGEPQLIFVKGADSPVPARRLLGMGDNRSATAHAESDLVGRRWEMSAVEGLLDRAVDGDGAVVGVVGPPGIGKSRLVHETAAVARHRDVEVFTTLCESHTSQVHFHAVTRLLRAAIGVEGLDGPSARDRVRERVPGADPEDLLLLDDLLGIADPNSSLLAIDPDARRRRLTALLNAASLARQTPTLYVVEDAHWIDEASESMLAAFITVIPQTPSLVLVTYRPEYEGALARVHGAQTIALAPLSDAETRSLVSGRLGSDPSVGALSRMVAERAAGNPFFAEEIVRDLAERGVLQGHTGAYVAGSDVKDAEVPATLQATIAARIDRLDPKAKRTLGAAAVLGARFTLELLQALRVEAVVDDLLAAQLIDQIRFTGRPEYMFHHPLIRSVAYESQLKSDRAELHLRVAEAIEAWDPAATEENAALIAEHLEAAGDLRAAYGWHMRAAAWATNRDTPAARLSWERAQQIADSLPADDPDRTTMRIAPRAALCGSAYRAHQHVAGQLLDELRQLCAAAGDKASLAVGMAGLVGSYVHQARLCEASQLASETMALVESIEDSTLTVGLSATLLYAKCQSGEYSEALRFSQRVIDLADGDSSMGSVVFGSPLAAALIGRGWCRFSLGLLGWAEDLEQCRAIARRADPLSYAAAVCYAYIPAIPTGLLRPDESATREIEGALQVAERSGDDLALAFAQIALGIVQVHRPTAAERQRGQKLLAEVAELCLRQGHNLCDLPLVNVYMAREMARRGDRDAAVPQMRAAVDDLVGRGQLLTHGIFTTGVLVETLLESGTESDVAEAEAAMERLAAAPAGDNLVMREIWLLRLRALLARSRGEMATYTDLRNRYRDKAESLGFEGHIDWAEAMR